ncbi:MAG: GNAT family N-acetyltransferase [Muribaculaceae bacterium]
MNPLLSNEIITLRALEPTDLDILYKWENDTSLWEVGNTITPYSREQLWEYLKDYDGDIYKSHQLRLMVTLTHSGESIGTIDFYDFDPFNNRAAIGILIDESHQGNGYGRQAIEITSRYAAHYIGLRQLLAIIPSKNIHSKHLFEKCGFQCSGTLQAWLKIGNDYNDVEIMQLLF